MRLAEAIRLGALLHPQAFRSLFTRDAPDVPIVATCALGAAYDAIGQLAPIAAGVPTASADWRAYTPRWPELTLLTGYPCPVCARAGGYQPVIKSVNIDWSPQLLITHLNDVHQWTRDAIADFLEREIEPQVYSTTEAAPAAPGLSTEPVYATR